MMRDWKLQSLGILLAGFVLVFGCKPAETGNDPGASGSPTPAEPGNPYTAEDYAKALRTASIKLRDKLPSVTDTTAILNAKEPRLEYELVIDRYLDPAQNPDLGPVLQTHYKKIFLMGDKTENVNHAGVAHTVNFNEPANLASYLVLNGLPYTDLLAAEYCVDDNLQQITCDTNSPVLAGLLTHPAFLRTFGKPSALNYQRSSITHQLMECQIYPDGTDDYIVRSNVADPDPSIIPPADDPGSPEGMSPRLHKKYQGTMGQQTCHSCHDDQQRRLLFAKYVTDDVNFNNVATGFYQADWTIQEFETPEENTFKCYTLPAGFTYVPGMGLPPNNNNEIYHCDAYAGDQNAIIASDARCCFDPALTDLSAEDVFVCNDPASPWCTQRYHGQTLSNPREYALAILDGSLNDNAFYKCQARRFYAWVVGTGEGALGLQASNGTLPDHPGDGVVEKYRSAFDHSGWNGLELLEVLFKGDEFLSSQVQ